jgi:hypothetical protein
MTSRAPAAAPSMHTPTHATQPAMLSTGGGKNKIA